MCLVEMGMPPRPAPGQEPELDDDGHQPIGWMPRPVIACANTVAENMGIRTQSDARRGVPQGRDGVPPHQPPARLPDLRPGRRVQPAGIQRRARQRRIALPRPEGQEAEERRHRPAHPPRRRALHHVLPLHPLHATRSPTIRCLGFTDRGSHTTLTVHPGKELDEQLLAQHRRHLPGRRAHLERLPLPDARLVPQGNRVDLHQLRHAAATPRSGTRENKVYRHHPAREQRGQLVLDAATAAGSISTTSTARAASPTRWCKDGGTHRPPTGPRRSAAPARAC